MEEYATSHHSINGNGMNLFHFGSSKKGGNVNMNKSTSSTTLSSSCNSIQNVTSLISPESSPLLTSKYQGNGTISKSSSSINNNNNNNNNGKIRKELPLIMDDSINNNNNNNEVFSSTFDQLSNHISQNKIFSDLNKFISNVHCATTSLASGNRSSPPSPPSNTSTPPTNSKLVEITSSTSSTNLLLSVSGSFLPKKNSRDYNNNINSNDEMTMVDELSPSTSSTSSVGGNGGRSYSRNSSSNNLHVLQQQQIQHQLQQQQQSQQQYEQYNNDNNNNSSGEWQLNEPVLKKKRKSLDLESNYKSNNNNSQINNNNSNNHVSYPNSPIIDNNDLQGVVQSQRKTILEQNEYIKQMEQKLEFYKNEHNGFKRKMASSIYDLLLIYEKNNNNLDDNCLPDKIKFPTTSQLKLNNNNNNSNNNILEYENNNLDSSISGLVKLNKSNEIQKPQQQQQIQSQPPQQLQQQPKKQVHILPKHGSNGNLKSYNDQPPPQLTKTNSLKQLQSQQTQYIFENISEQQAKLIKRN